MRTQFINCSKKYKEKKYLEEKKELGLIERIGIDKSRLNNIFIKDIDETKINQHQHRDENREIVIEYGDTPVILQSGRCLRRLKIKDERIGLLSFRYGKRTDGKTHATCSLQLLATNNSNNLQNLTVQNYKKRVVEAFELITRTYGIVLDYSQAKIKSLEVNATFRLQDDFGKYEKVILMMIRNVPQVYKDKRSNSLKYHIWREAAKDYDKLETVLAKNQSVELKIYNKLKQLKDTGAISNIAENNVMRIEYTFKNASTLKSRFGANTVNALSDEALINMFKWYFVRDIVKPWEKWQKDNKHALCHIASKYMQSGSDWKQNFFRECREFESTHGLPVLFDVCDMQPVFRLLDKSKNANRKFQRFKKSAKFETDLIGNTKRMQEVINKVMSM